MEVITAAGNIEPPVYQMLLERGYKIQYKEDYFIAKKDDLEVKAYNIIELAGIIFLREVKGHKWKVDDEKIDNYIDFLKKSKA